MINNNGGLDIVSILTLEESYIEYYSSNKYIRPVITLEEDILNRLDGSGTKDSPYDLDKYYESIVIVTETANEIPEGTYYYLGLNDQTTKLVIDASGNEFCYEGTCNDATVAIDNGNITVTTSILDSSYTFSGNYYETIQNKILTFGTGEFGTTNGLGTNYKNSRLGFLMAINNKDLKHDIVGTYKPSLTGGNHVLNFIDNLPYAQYQYKGSDIRNFYYAGFKDMFYMNNVEIKYIGLQDGFGWADPESTGTYFKVD